MTKDLQADLRLLRLAAEGCSGWPCCGSCWLLLAAMSFAACDRSALKPSRLIVAALSS